MPPRRLRTLIIGLAMMILGPPLGYVGWIALMVHAALPGQANPSIAEALGRLQQLPGQLLAALIPLVLGVLCGAAGLFLVVATLAIHFLGQDPGPALSFGISQQPAPTPHPLPHATADESRYMPKYR
jgi:hypothetical protein